MFTVPVGSGLSPLPFGHDEQMTPPPTLLLIAGLIFPVISLLSRIGTLVHQWRHKKYSSPVFIPFIGPFLLTSWVICAHKPLWIIGLVWVSDIGTLAFLAVSSRLIREWWRTSTFTRTLTLHGTQDNQRATITFHSTGHYLLKKSWSRPPGQLGIIALGEPGTFNQSENQYALTSHVGLRRVLRETDERAYRVEEQDRPREELRDYSLSGWVLRS